MEFQLLDKYFHMNEIEVLSEYSRIISKNIFKGGDYDSKLILILDSINEKSGIFTDKEISIISLIVSMRKSNIFVEFSKIYPLFKETFFSSAENSREKNLNIISQLLSTSINKDDYESLNLYNSPIIKNVRSNLSLSPTFDNSSEEFTGLSNSYKPEMFFGWTDN